MAVFPDPGGAGCILDRFSLEDIKSDGCGEVRGCLQLCAYKIWGEDGWINAQPPAKTCFSVISFSQALKYISIEIHFHLKKKKPSSKYSRSCAPP